MAGALLAAATLAGAAAGPTLAAPTPAKTRTAPPVKGARGVMYGGSTTAGTPIVVGLSRDGSRVTRLLQQFRATCTSGNHLNQLVGPGVDAPIAGNGRFTATKVGTVDLGGGVSARETATLTATVKALKLSGSSTLHAEVVDAAGAVIDTCDQAVTFKAASSAGRVFAGQTSRGGPIVLELAGNGGSVRHFHIGWSATCTPAGSLSFGDTLRNFPIVAGRFGDRFGDVSTGPDGQIKIAYSIRGRLSARKGTGTFRMTITRTDPAGAATTCDTGSLKYRATSG